MAGPEGIAPSSGAPKINPTSAARSSESGSSSAAAQKPSGDAAAGVQQLADTPAGSTSSSDAVPHAERPVTVQGAVASVDASDAPNTVESFADPTEAKYGKQNSGLDGEPGVPAIMPSISAILKERASAQSTNGDFAPMPDDESSASDVIIGKQGGGTPVEPGSDDDDGGIDLPGIPGSIIDLLIHGKQGGGSEVDPNGDPDGPGGPHPLLGGGGAPTAHAKAAGDQVGTESGDSAHDGDGFSIEDALAGVAELLEWIRKFAGKQNSGHGGPNAEGHNG